MSTSKSRDVCEVNDMLKHMTTVDNKLNDVSVCANCGKTGDNLKSCTACKLVKYCNRECQIAHRSKHKKECKKRAAELHDEKLFKQPPPAYGDCPICFLRLPTLETGFRYQPCCGKVICSGCIHAPVYDNQGNEVDNQKCAFCRTPFPSSQEEANRRREKRIEAGDAFAMFYVGYFYSKGSRGYPQDYTKALELWHRAGELGHAEAHNNIGVLYNNGQGVDADREKASYFYELAAMKGEAQARHNLGGIEEEDKGNFDRALKHYMIAARDGQNISLEAIKEMYSNGYVTKEDYMKALQAYQEYLGEIKSKQRDEAAAADEEYRYY